MRRELSERRLRDADNDAAALTIFADADSAMTSLAVTIGFERRGAVLRQRSYQEGFDL